MPVAAQAAPLGLLAGSALLLGAAVAWFGPLPQRLIAVVMALGAGVLISAVSLELMEDAAASGVVVVGREVLEPRAGEVVAEQGQLLVAATRNGTSICSRRERPSATTSLRERKPGARLACPSSDQVVMSSDHAPAMSGRMGTCATGRAMSGEISGYSYGHGSGLSVMARILAAPPGWATSRATKVQDPVKAVPSPPGMAQNNERQSPGVNPVIALNEDVRWAWLEKPASRAMKGKGRLPCVMSRLASSIRRSRT